MVERLDEERLEMLRSWGSGLATSSRDELRAAGRAILMLVDEIDRLQVDVWNARAAATRESSSARRSRSPRRCGSASRSVRLPASPAPREA